MQTGGYNLNSFFSDPSIFRATPTSCVEIHSCSPHNRQLLPQQFQSLSSSDPLSLLGGLCISLLRFLEENTMGWVASTTEMHFLAYVEAGHPR